jgi:hypothetical protein
MLGRCEQGVNYLIGGTNFPFPSFPCGVACDAMSQFDRPIAVGKHELGDLGNWDMRAKRGTVRNHA